MSPTSGLKMDKERTSDTLNPTSVEGEIPKLPTPCDLEKTCGTCKFRGENIIWPDPDNDFNDTDSGYAQCERIKFAESGFNGPGNGAIVQDGSGYYGRLCVEADFGCVKWESKNNENLEG